MPDQPNDDRHSDAFGMAVQAQYSSANASEIIERDDGFLTSTSMSKYFEEYSEWRALDQRLIDLVDGPTLDVGCGAGRHALYLQTRGIDVCAIDSSPGCVDVAQKRGVSRVILADIAHVDSLNVFPFQYVLMMGANLGLLGSVDQAAYTLKLIDAVTASTARVIGTTLDYTKTTEPVHLAYHKKNMDAGKLAGTIKMRVRWLEYASDWFDYIFYTKADMDRVLEGSAWEIHSVYEDSTRTGLTSSGILGFVLTKKIQKNHRSQNC